VVAFEIEAETMVKEQMVEAAFRKVRGELWAQTPRLRMAATGRSLQTARRSSSALWTNTNWWS
jgi:hypothetical protein